MLCPNSKIYSIFAYINGPLQPMEQPIIQYTAMRHSQKPENLVWKQKEATYAVPGSTTLQPMLINVDWD
jgi:hypothetical protein